jgi:hypothetical protein
MSLKLASTLALVCAPLYSVYVYVYMLRKKEAQAIFLNPLTVCLLCKWKSAVCPFIDEETNRSYPFANRLTD